MDAPTPRVQRVTKASSDQLLRKFSDSSDDEASPARKSLCKRRKRNVATREVMEEEEGDDESLAVNLNAVVVERKSLLPKKKKMTMKKKRLGSGPVILELGFGRSNQIRKSRDFTNKSVLVAIEKTWSKAIRGASKVFMEKHHNRHKRLISDLL